MKSLRLPRPFVGPYVRPYAGRVFAGMLAALPLLAPWECLSAAPKTAAKTKSTLSFRVKAQFTYLDEADTTSDKSLGDSLDAKVTVQGNRARLETSVGSRPLVVLFSPPYVYKLLPLSKTGRRYSLSKVSKNPGMAGLNPQPWLRDPKEIRAALKKQGGKLVGTATQDGVPVEIWNATQFMGRTGQVKAWLRRSDALPVRLEVKSKQLSATATWRDYQKNSTQSDSLFAPPAGYRIREADE